MSKELPDLTQIAGQILEQQSQHRRALSLLLDEVLKTAKHILVERTEMGGSEAFVGSVSLEWFGEKVRFVGQLPLFVQKIDVKTGNVTIDADTIEEVQQRPLDWSRQAPLAQYLAARKAHKFPPVLVVINRPWVDKLNADEWDKDKRAVRSAADFLPLDSEGRVGLLDVSEDATLFALDGQHRLMGVQGLLSLIKTGSLQRYDREKKSVGSPITTEELIKKYKLTPDYLQGLSKERIGIEFIPAVVPGETREDARRRVRSVFVHVNKMATPLTPGQLAQLEEDDGFAIVARKTAVSHELLKKKEGRPPRVNWNKANLATRAEELTTLQTLKDVAMLYLVHKFPTWKRDEPDLIPLRPEESDLEEGGKEFSELLDQLAMLPSLKAIEQGATPGQFRRFADEKINGKGGQGHVLFRPAGQTVLAQALGVLVFQRHLPLTGLVTKLQKLDKEGGFNMESPKSVFYGVLYDPNKHRVYLPGKPLAVRLLVYLLGGGVSDDKERQNLREEFAKARTFEEKARDLNGKLVKPEEIDLPLIL